MAKSRRVADGQRAERANRILDAAAELTVRWGYDKTTIEDISRQAGVAKGTIYLHWKTREALFDALITREGARLLEDLQRRIAADPPEGSTLHGMLRHSALALMERPLLKALVLRDVDVIGKLVHSEASSLLVTEKLAGFQVYLELLREQGLVRRDLSLRAEMYLLSAVYLGFLLVTPLLPDELALPDDQVAGLMAETVQRVIEIDRPVPGAKDQAAARSLSNYVDRFGALLQEQARQAVDGNPAAEPAQDK